MGLKHVSSVLEVADACEGSRRVTTEAGNLGSSSVTVVDEWERACERVCICACACEWRAWAESACRRRSERELGVNPDEDNESSRDERRDAGVRPDRRPIRCE